MILKETLRSIVNAQKEELKLDQGIIERGIKVDTSLPHAIIISGIRRCGKSTLLKQLIRKFKIAYYLNFEDPKALNFSIEDFDKLDEIFKEHGHSKYYFFDEIQNVNKWENFVRKLLDKKKRCIITGSNASLLSKELGTKLTGRHITYELFPFSYKEMLKYKKNKPSLTSLKYYCKNGGFPEYLKYGKGDIPKELFNDILARDIIVRHNIRETKIIKEIALYLITNSGKEFSYNNLAKIFNIGSANSVISYISYFEDSYLLFTVPKFDYSLKKQAINPKKIYNIDVGFAIQNSTSFSLDLGRVLENIVFLHLRRKYKDIYYFREKKECDFIIKERDKKLSAIQVCYELKEDNYKRELEGLKEAMNFLNLKEGTIVTLNQEETIDNINVVPAWKWLLNF